MMIYNATNNYTAPLYFDGKTYDPSLDQDRLTKQLGRAYETLSSGNWYTLLEATRLKQSVTMLAYGNTGLGWFENMRTRKHGIFKEGFFSICSRHQKFDKSCELCNVGTWHNLFTNKISGVLYAVCPKVWQIWANRPWKMTRWANQFEYFDSGKSANPFPNLR